jgi:anthranilate phosphoribosyltransferase
MPDYKVMGVPNREMIDIEVRTLKELGFKKAFVMHGLDDNSDQGMDEVSTLGVTHVAELKEDGSIENYEITPDDFGIKRGKFDEIASTRDVQRDAHALLSVLVGKDTGPRADIVCLNAAPLLYIMGVSKDLKQGVEMARQAISDGKPVDKLRDWVTWQNDSPEDGLPTLEKLLSQL